MHAMLLAGLLLLLGVRGAGGYRASGGDFVVPESLAQHRQLFKQLGVVGKAKLETAKCETEVQGGVPTVVLLSGTGEGKSTTTCVISGNPALAHVAEEGKTHSETSKSCIHRASWFFPYDHSEPLYLIDTPGFGDTRGGDRIEYNNVNIVNTLKQAGHAHAILWVLSSADPKLSKGRQDAFRFVRSYFGKKVYEHIVFVYTHYSWKPKQGGRAGKKADREKALEERHFNTMTALLNQVETEFWPDGKVDSGTKNTILHLPKFAFNTYAVDMGDDDGGMLFADDDIEEEDYNENDPDGFAGVFNPETYRKETTPNSATQLRELKAKILEISREKPVDLTSLRPFQDGCKAALKDNLETDPVVFGQHVTDCVEGQQYKLLKDEVVPYVNGLPDGPVFAAFCINAYTRGRGQAGDSLRDEAMERLDIPPSARENVTAFASYGAYVSCCDATPGPEPAFVAKSLSKCLGGIASHGTPPLVEAMKQRFFGKEGRSKMQPAYIANVVAEIGKLPEHERATIGKYMDFQSLLSRRVQLAVRSRSGFDLGSLFVVLTPSTTLASIEDGSVYKLPMVKMLQKQGWVRRVDLLDSDENHLVSDEDLQLAIADIMAKEATPSVPLVAQVSWVDKSPPDKLDPELLKVCLDNQEPLAAQALVDDHLLNPNVLVFTDPEQVMPNTQDYGAIFKGVAGLKDAAVKAFRADTKAEASEQAKALSSVVDKVGNTRQILQPYLDEVKGDAGGRTKEANQLQKDMVGKVNKLLSEVQGTSVLKVPAAVPSQATPEELFAFTTKLDAELRIMEDMTKGKAPLSIEELIYQSRVLRGVYIGQVAEPKASDLIQVTKMPAPMSILTPPSSAKEQTEMSTRSARTISSAKTTLKKGGNSFAGSLSVSGAGVGNWGVGAVHTAGKVSSAMEETAEMKEKGMTESHSFHSLRTVIHPMRLLELGGKNTRLTSKFLQETARILYKDEERWQAEIEPLFNMYGTHYCPSVEMGGTYSVEASYHSSTSFKDTEVASAMAKCTSAELEVGGGAFFGAGFVKASGSATTESCKADSSKEVERTQKMMQSTTIKTSCFANMEKCPANKDSFISGLQVNSNWAVIDRKMTKCVAVWDALQSDVYLDDLLRGGAGEPPSGSAARTQASVDKLRDLMAKVWHVRVLGLPQLCKIVMGDDNSGECKEIKAVNEGPPNKLIELPLQNITSLWEKVKTKADALLHVSRQCFEKKWCNQQHGQGECKKHEMPGTRVNVMHCECNATFSGEFCGEKIPKKACTKWRTTDCMVHGSQPGCETLWDKEWRKGDWNYCSIVGLNTGVTGRVDQCKKTYECQPDTEGQDCCGSLEGGERWYK